MTNRTPPYPIDVDPTSFILTIGTGDRPVTMNAERRGGGHFAQNRHTRAWKEATQWEARASRVAHLRLDRVAIHFTPTYPPKSGNAPDTGALYPTEKAIIDGLVAEGILPDDNGLHVASILTEAPRIAPDADYPVMIVTVTEAEPLTEAEYHGRWLLASH